MSNEFRPLNQEEIDKIVNSIKSINFTELVEALKGRSGGLRTGRPKDNLHAYIWRWTRFHGGIDMRQPVTDEFYFYDHNKSVLGYKPTTFRVPDEIRKMIDKIVDDVCDHFKLDKFAAAKRYKGLLY